MLDTGDNASVSLNAADWNAIFSHDSNAPIQKTLVAGAGNKVSETSFVSLSSLNIDPYGSMSERIPLDEPR